jgi:hypothetical protein
MSYLLLTILLLLPLSATATPRNDELVCEEVHAVLQEAVDEGFLTQETADHVTDGCYSSFSI